LLLEDSNLLYGFLSVSFGPDIEHFPGLFGAFFLDMFVVDEVIVLVDNMIHFMDELVKILVFAVLGLFFPAFSVLFELFNLLLDLLNLIIFVQGWSNFPQLDIGSDGRLIIFFLSLNDLVHRLNLVPEFSVKCLLQVLFLDEDLLVG
jgi:hypothetical protein